MYAWVLHCVLLWVRTTFISFCDYLLPSKFCYLLVLELTLNNDSFNTKTCNVRSTGSWLYKPSLSLSHCNKGDWNKTSSLRPSTPIREYHGVFQKWLRVSCYWVNTKSSLVGFFKLSVPGNCFCPIFVLFSWGTYSISGVSLVARGIPYPRHLMTVLEVTCRMR